MIETVQTSRSVVPSVQTIAPTVSVEASPVTTRLLDVGSDHTRFAFELTGVVTEPVNECADESALVFVEVPP